MLRKNEEITWENIWKYWTTTIKIYEPKLSAPINIKQIYVDYKGQGYFYGYDWIEKDYYQKQVEYVSKKPADFLYFGKALNKGTLRTLECWLKQKIIVKIEQLFGLLHLLKISWIICHMSGEEKHMVF